MNDESKNLFYEKTIILKEENETNLENRLRELMKFEEEKLVIFGIFSCTIKTPKIVDIFATIAKNLFKSNRESKGRIWCLEVNGSGRGCGVVAADDKIWTWKDKIPVKKSSKCIKVVKKSLDDAK